VRACLQQWVRTQELTTAGAQVHSSQDGSYRRTAEMYSDRSVRQQFPQAQLPRLPPPLQYSSSHLKRSPIKAGQESSMTYHDRKLWQRRAPGSRQKRDPEVPVECRCSSSGDHAVCKGAVTCDRSVDRCGAGHRLNLRVCPEASWRTKTQHTADNFVTA
jgi:hypothetical protein